MSIDYTYEDCKMMAISDVCAANANQKSYVFNNYREYLSDVHFIFVDENGANVISPYREMFKIDEPNLVSMFSKDTLNVINEDILNGKRAISFSCDIGLDTQIISYIEKYVRGVLDEHLISTVKPLQIKRTLESEINVDAYVFENYLKNKQLDQVGKLSVWSVYYFLNTPLMDKVNAQIEADKALVEINSFITRSPRTIIYLDRYYLCYSFLLKIVKLYFENISLKKKLLKLITFENEEIFTAEMMFINLALAFWEQGTKLRFFGKVQKGKKSIISTLKNMAWDLTHWVNTTLDCVYSKNFKSDLFVNLFYTIDNRFLELKNILKMECVAIDKKEKKVFPCYKNQLDKFFTLDEQQELYGGHALHKRNLYRKTVDTNELVTKLEKELLDTNLFI